VQYGPRVTADRGQGGRLEIVSTGLLALATVATAWSGFPVSFGV